MLTISFFKFQLKVELSDPASEGLCVECVEFLIKCKSFRDKCLESQERIKYNLSQQEDYGKLIYKFDFDS